MLLHEFYGWLLIMLVPAYYTTQTILRPPASHLTLGSAPSSATLSLDGGAGPSYDWSPPGICAAPFHVDTPTTVAKADPHYPPDVVKKAFPGTTTQAHVRRAYTLRGNQLVEPASALRPERRARETGASPGSGGKSREYEPRETRDERRRAYRAEPRDAMRDLTSMFRELFFFVVVLVAVGSISAAAAWLADYLTYGRDTRRTSPQPVRQIVAVNRARRQDNVQQVHILVPQTMQYTRRADRMRAALPNAPPNTPRAAAPVPLARRRRARAEEEEAREAHREPHFRRRVAERNGDFWMRQNQNIRRTVTTVLASATAVGAVVVGL